MTCKITFYVNNDQVEETKHLVRQFPSLRFRSNPLRFGGFAEFCLEGEIEDFNCLDKELNDRNQALQSNQEVSDAGFWSRLFRKWLGR